MSNSSLFLRNKSDISVAQRKGFEPLYAFLHNTISNRARSTAPPSLQQLYYYILFHEFLQAFLTRIFNFLKIKENIARKTTAPPPFGQIFNR